MSPTTNRSVYVGPPTSGARCAICLTLAEELPPSAALAGFNAPTTLLEAWDSLSEVEPAPMVCTWRHGAKVERAHRGDDACSRGLGCLLSGVTSLDEVLRRAERMALYVVPRPRAWPTVGSWPRDRWPITREAYRCTG